MLYGTQEKTLPKLGNNKGEKESQEGHRTSGKDDWRGVEGLKKKVAQCEQESSSKKTLQASTLKKVDAGKKNKKTTLTKKGETYNRERKTS